MTQNIIDFKDGKYVFEEIEGKGKCLVPYIKLVTKYNLQSIPAGTWFIFTSSSKIPSMKLCSTCVNRRKMNVVSISGCVSYQDPLKEVIIVNAPKFN